jgi:hypothetical protein
VTIWNHIVTFVLGWLCCWIFGVLRDTRYRRPRRLSLPLAIAKGTLRSGRVVVKLERFRANDRDRAVLHLDDYRRGDR